MAEHEEKHGEHKEGHEEGGHKKGHGGHGGHGGGHGDEHGGVAEWLISFADNVALLMGFFVILLAMNMNKPKPGGSIGGDPNSGSPDTNMLDFVLGLREAFNNPIDLNSNNPNELKLRERAREVKLAKERGQQNSPVGTHERSHAQDKPATNAPTQTIGFDRNSTAINSEARRLLESFAPFAKGSRFIITVRGHVNPGEVRADDDAQRLAAAHRLAIDRALVVVKTLTDLGVDPRLLRIESAAYNERARTGPTTDSVNRQNQKVELYKTTEEIDDSALSRDPATTP